MIRNLKALGLMAVAAIAMSAMLASAAQAEVPGVFTSGDTETGEHTASNVTGLQYGTAADNFFEGVAGSGETVSCSNQSNFTAHEDDAVDDGTATALTVTANYIHCETNGGQAATVSMNGCDYIFTQPTRIAPGEYTGKADLTCPHSNAIEIRVFGFGGVTSHSFLGCTIKVFPKGGHTQSAGETTHRVQELGGHVIYKNGVNAATGKDDVTVNATITGISSSRSGFGCASSSSDNGIYRNLVTVTGADQVDPHDVSVADHS